MKAALVPVERIERQILLIRGQKVLPDSQLAELYGVATGNLVRAMKCNIERFPEDFMFQLFREEFTDLRCHFDTSSEWGGRRYPPYAFTEHAVAIPNVSAWVGSKSSSTRFAHSWTRRRWRRRAGLDTYRKQSESKSWTDNRRKPTPDARSINAQRAGRVCPARSKCRGRDRPCGRPPAQIRT